MKIGRLNRASFAKTARRAMFLFAFAVLGTQAATVATVDGTGYETLEAAIAAAEPVDGVVTYEICGKAEVSATGWIQVLKSGLSNVKKVAFVGKTEDAEICIAGDLAILADQQYDIDVSFRNLKLSKPNPKYGGDYGHSTNYFTTWLRNTGAAENTVTYENCTFPNGACNNQYGKTVYTNCTFANGTTGLYNLWIYGGSVEMDGGVFTGTRGMKVYTEGTPATAPSVEVKGTAFSGLTEKAAIVVSKAATVKFAEVSVADCPKGLFQKDIEGSSDDQKVTVTANGSKISGSFAITANREPETAKTEFNITGGMFTAEVPSDYCADGFTVKATTDADGNTVYGVVEKTELVNYVTLELVFGDNVADEDVVAAKALYAQEKYETCKAANEAYMALFGVTWGKGYLDVTDNTAPLYKYAGRSGSVSEVRFYIHGTLAGFTSLQSSGNQIDCTVGGNHQISRTSYSIIGVDGADGKAKLTDGNVQAYVAGGYASMFTASGKLTIDNIEFTSTTSTTVGASATRATESDTENEVASAEMEIKNCTFRGRLYVYDNFENQGKMTYSIHNCVFDGSNYSGDSNAYAIFAQCKGGNNLVIKDNAIAGFARGINIDHANVHATIEGNTISVTDTGRSCIQLSSLATADIVGNTLELTGGNAITLHEKLLTLGVVPKVSISGNTVTGTGYLVYDDAVANGKAFTSDNLKLTYATDNVVAATVDTTQGVKDAEKYALSGTVATTLHSVDFAAFVKALTDAGYTFDGNTHALAQNGKLTVKWSPVSGCYDKREGHECTVGNVAAMANTPKRVNSGLTQFQLFEGESHAVNVKNVAFVYEPAAFTVCENSRWNGSFTADDAPAGQIYLMNTGDVTFEGCTFDKVVLTSFNCTGTSTVKDCSFKNVYNSYAVKDIRGAKVAVTGCAFENCGAAVMVSSTVKVEEVTISGNTFTKVDVAGTTPDNKVGTRGLVQIASLGNYADTAFDFSGNTATDCGPVLRQLNSTVSFDTDDKANLGKLVSDGGASTFYTDDTFVAQVGDTKYATLAEAIAVLSAENHTLTLLNENAWNAATPVYWAAGAQSGYAATLTDALTAAYKANEGAITIVCRPGADVGEMTHGHVADDLTIYGNNAFISGGECDLEVDTYTFSRATGKQATDGAYLAKDITITAYELDNLGVWGERHTDHTVTVNLTDCDGKALEGKTNLQRVYISGTTGVNNITLTGCDFLTKATAVYSNADGAIKAVNCSFTGGEVPFNINHKANGTQTVAVENCTFTNCGDAGDWKQFAAPLRLVNSGTGTQSAEVTGCAFAGTVGANGDILLGDGRTGQASNDVELKVVNTAANIQAQKPGYYNGETVDETKKATATSLASGTLETSVAKLLPVNDGSEAHPYSREQFAAMTRADYIAAQERLGGTLYVNVGDYAYEKDGVLGNGVRNDTTGQIPDHAKLNAYGENGYLGEKNDGANGHTVVFVGGTIASGVTGYTSIDSIGTSLLLAVPAYTKVTFEKTTFKNVLSFNYQLYTSPWSQLGGLTFNGCTFDGIIVGAIAAQELAFNGCTFNNYVNTTSANSSNPTWIRPAYGNWTKGDNEGQGTDFRSLTKITFENNTVTSTRPVKFERIAQWEMATTVTATNNTFAITPQEGDKDEKKTKNVGLYFGANAKFNLVIDKNEKSDETAALYTAVYTAPNGGTYAGLPAGSTVKNTAGEEVATEDALAWKTTKKITLKTTTEVASVTNAKGVSVNFATLADAIAAAQAGETVTLLADVESVSVTTVVAGKDIVLDLNGKTLTSTANNGITIEATAKLTVKDSLTGGKVVATGKYSNAIENKGTLVIESGSFEAVYGAIRALGGSTTTISGGTFASSTGRYGMYYWANGTALSVTVNGGLFKNPVSTAMENGKVALSIKGGSFASDLTDYCGADAGTYLDKETGLYVYGRESEHVPEGYVVDENGNVTISDEESLFWFAQQVNVRGNTFTGKTVSLADDIALTAKWTPVGVSVEKSFKGTFDGKDHAITGMKVSGASQAYGYGFFKLVISATVKNVTFTQAEVRSEYSNVVGCVAGYSYGSSTFENVHVTDSLVYAFGKVGGFVGMAEDAGATTTFRNCSVEATTIHGGYNVAGFCGLVMGTCAFSGSSLTDVTPVVDEDSQGFGKVVELDTTVVCDGSVATCAGTGTSIKGRYIPNNGYYWSAYSDLYNHYGDSKHDCTLADGKMLANSEVVHDAPVAIGDARYSDLQAAFDAAKTGDTVTLLSDITLTEQVNITKALDGLTLDGNGKTIICATTDDPLKSGGSALYFGNANDHLYCTGIKIKDLTMTGTARFAIFLCGGTTTEFTNVKVSGNYYIAVNLYGTHGATMTNCDISNSTKGTDKYISAIWSNVASANPLTLNNSKVDVIAINTYTTANKLEPKIFVMDGSEVGEIHTFDDGSVSGNKKLCVSDGSTGSYVVKEYDEATSTWVNLRVAQIGTVGYETLEAALAAATDGDTITLLADVTVAEQLVVEKPLTLDLGGKTVTSTYAIPASLSSGEARYALLTKAPVTVTNGTFAAGQARALGAYANLTLTDATVTSELIGGHCCVAFCAAGGIYTVANATIKGDYAIANFAHNATIAITGSALEGSGCGLYHNGSNYGLKLTVSDTTINGAIDQAIGEGKDPSGVYLSGSLDVLANAENQNGAKGRHQATFTRCTIKGNTGVEVKYTDLTLEDCTVVATTEVPSYTQNNNGMAALGFAVVSTDNATGNATPKPEGTITITGADGSYTGLVGLGSLDSVKTGFADFEDAHYAVSGGTFSDAVLPEYCAAGFIPTANDDGTYGVKEGAYVAQIGSIGYETLEAALAAAKDGETVKLLADVTESVTIAADRTLTLDLNGKTLSAGKASEALTVTGHLTIDDTSAAKSGRVVGDGRYAVYMNNRTAHVGEAAVGGSLTLNAGSLEGATHGVYILANQAAFTMNGGKVSATQAESIRVNNDYHAKTISLLSGEVGDVFLGSISSTELTTLTVGKADQTDPAAVKVGKIGLQYNRGLFRLELYNGLVGELPEIGPSCTATYTALGMLVKSDANCPSGKVFEAIDYNGETWYRIAALQKIAITFDDSKTVALPFATDWLKAHVGEGEASWTTAALEEKAANGLAKWQCYLFGLDPSKKDAKVVATAGQGTDKAIPLTVANADASASPLVTGGYVTVAYVLMGSNDRTAWTQVKTSDKRDGLVIPLTGTTTYKFYRVDVTVTSAEGN